MPRLIALATCSKLPELWRDDLPLPAAFAARGTRAVPCVWDAQEVRWTNFDGVLLRSTWDYTEKYAAFLQWLDRLDAEHVPLWNSTRTVRWNSDKKYLDELAAEGIVTVPTLRSTPAALGESIAKARDRGWRQLVVKPAISAGARMTMKLGPGDSIPTGATWNSDVLVQPYFSEIESRGEWSLLYFGGVFSHAVLKRPHAGDFRTQPQFRAKLQAADPPGAIRKAADLCLEAAQRLQGETLVYARVDLLETGMGTLLGELELIEPCLYFEHTQDGPRRLVEALRSRLSS